MTDETRTNSPEAADTASGPTPESINRDPGPDARIDPTQALQAEVGELKDRLLRTLADMENLRRRTEKEIKDAREYAITAFARDLLSVGDNLTRAIQAIPAELRGSEDAGIKPLVEGVDMTGRELLKALDKHGVKKLEPLGTKFDPNVHQAMYEIPNSDVPNGTVLNVLQDGFVIGDRVLRPALVGVAKGGPKAAAHGGGLDAAPEAKPQPEPAKAEPGAGFDKTV